MRVPASTARPPRESPLRIERRVRRRTAPSRQRGAGRDGKPKWGSHYPVDFRGALPASGISCECRRRCRLLAADMADYAEDMVAYARAKSRQGSGVLQLNPVVCDAITVNAGRGNAVGDPMHLSPCFNVCPPVGGWPTLPLWLPFFERSAVAVSRHHRTARFSRLGKGRGVGLRCDGQIRHVVPSDSSQFACATRPS